MELQVETRNVELAARWSTKIDEEKERLTRHHGELVHHLRVSIEANSHHRQNGYEVRLVASVPQSTVVVKKAGEAVSGLLVEAFDTLGEQLKEFQRKRRQQVKPQEEGDL